MLQRLINLMGFVPLLRPNCFQIVVQHFSEEHYIFYFAGETPEQTQVRDFVDKYNFKSNFFFVL